MTRLPMTRSRKRPPTTDADAAAGESGLADLLTVENFNADRVVEAIEGSELGAVQKNLLTEAVRQVGDDPAAVSAVIDQVREALGL